MARSPGGMLSLVALAVVVSGVLACSYTTDWELQPVAQRMKEAKIAVYGYVTAHYPFDVNWPIEEVYIAEMELYCTFKGGPLPDRINISHVGDYTSCSVTHLPQGKEYILLLQKQGQGFVLDEVNLQTAAFPPTNANFYYVSRDPAVEVSDEACARYSGNETIPCFETGVDHESCDGAGGLGASWLPYLVMLLPWTYTRLMQSSNA